MSNTLTFATAPAGALGAAQSGARSRLALRVVNPLEDPSWDANLAACPGATFFHTAVWARVLHCAYGYRPAYFMAGDGSNVRPVLPLMEVDSWLTGRRGVSLPFTDECAPLSGDAGSFRRNYADVLRHAKSRRWKYLEVRGSGNLFDNAPASASFFGHRLDLQAPEATLFSRFDPSVRRAIRKGENGGLTLEFSRDIEAVRDFHRLMRITRRRHGVPPQPFHFFVCIQRYVLAQKQGWVVLARHKGVPVAGAIYFHFGKTVIYKYGASDEKFQHLRANNVVMWEAIKRHAAEGFATLDFGRTARDNEGLRKFKLSWGASEHTIDYVRQNPSTGHFAAAKAPGAGLLARLFQILPDPILRLIGVILYKHMA